MERHGEKIDLELCLNRKSGMLQEMESRGENPDSNHGTAQRKFLKCLHLGRGSAGWW